VLLLLAIPAAAVGGTTTCRTLLSGNSSLVKLA
jgi:hypothetical protein